MSKIKVLGKELLCALCGSGDWSHSLVKLEFGNPRIDEKISVEYRYLFSCNSCGLEQQFGKIYNWCEGESNFTIID